MSSSAKIEVQSAMVLLKRIFTNIKIGIDLSKVRNSYESAYRNESIEQHMISRRYVTRGQNIFGNTFYHKRSLDLFFYGRQVFWSVHTGAIAT